MYEEEEFIGSRALEPSSIIVGCRMEDRVS